jgi:hypothetical protein
MRMTDQRTTNPTPVYLSAPPTAADPGLAAALVLILLAALPLLAFAGLPNTADGPAHLMRQAELNQAWQEGILYPRWAPDLAYGYGMPLFSYAPPLLYQVTQILHLTGIPLDDALKGTLILMMALYGAGMYLFARDAFGPRAGLLAAAAYLYAPYRLREVYIQGNYGQFCGLAFYPLILWAFHRLARDGRHRYIVAAAFALAGLLLSHNISFMLFAPLLLAYLAYLLVVGGNADRPRLALRFALAAGLGLGLSAVFWLPAFGERDFIRLSGITSGFFDFRNNFIDLDELLATPRRLDLAAINPHFPLGLGTAQIVLVGVLLLAVLLCGLWRLALRSQRVTCAAMNSAQRRGSLTAFFAIALLAYAFLALPQSRPVWEGLPLLELAEFPWRMLGGAILCAAVLAGALVHYAERMAARIGREDQVGRAVLAGGLVLVVGAATPYLFPVQFIPWGTPGPAEVMAYEVHSGAIGTTSTGEFLPRWADRHPSPDVLAVHGTGDTIGSRLDPASLPAGGETATLRHVAGETVLRLFSPQPFVATFRVLYWPGWTVWISPQGAVTTGEVRDWQPVAGQTISHPDGLIQAPLPSGRYLVRLTLEDTPLRAAGWVLSVVSLTACIALGVVSLRRGRRAVRSAAGNLGYPRREVAVVVGALVLGLLVTRPLGDWMRLRSPAGSVVGVQRPMVATFGDRIDLLGYDLPDCTHWLAPVHCTFPPDDRLPELHVAAGGALSAVLYWQARQSLDTNYSVFLHLDAPDGGTVAGTDETNPEDIPSSTWPPTLYLRNPLTLNVPDDVPPIRYTLTSGLYDRATGTRLAATGCGGCESLPLAHVWVIPTGVFDAGRIPHRLDYRLGDSIELLGYAINTGAPAQVTLYWRASARQPIAYTVFVHVRDADGHIISQSDGPPLGGLYPTDAWLPGQIVTDVHALMWTPQVESLAVGLYDPTTMQRLAVTDERGQVVSDAAIVLQVPRGSR